MAMRQEVGSNDSQPRAFPRQELPVLPTEKGQSPGGDQEEEVRHMDSTFKKNSCDGADVWTEGDDVDASRDKKSRRIPERVGKQVWGLCLPGTVFPSLGMAEGWWEHLKEQSDLNNTSISGKRP